MKIRIDTMKWKPVLVTSAFFGAEVEVSEEEYKELLRLERGRAGFHTAFTHLAKEVLWRNNGQ